MMKYTFTMTITPAMIHTTIDQTLQKVKKKTSLYLSPNRLELIVYMIYDFKNGEFLSCRYI